MAVLAACLLVPVVGSTSTSAAALAMAPGCAGANVRSAPSLSGALKVSLPLGASVTVGGTVPGGSWSAVCPTAQSGSTWYVVTAVNGVPVSSAYGAAALYAATGVLTAAPTPTQLGSTVTFYGRGSGEGVGMSQYGARGRALAGQDAPTILAHYYQGTTIGQLADNPSVRVLLEDETATQSSPLTVYGRGGPWSIDGIAASLPADARASVYQTGTGWRLVVDSGGTELVAADAPSTVNFRPASPATTIQIASMASYYNQYRGVVSALLLSSSKARLINVVSMEDYLRGVVPAEMPSTWPVQALEAQAIAARSYADYRLHPATGTFDLYDDTRSQVYLGVLTERPTTDAAIATTAGQVVMSGTQVANALYNSTAGGATEDNQLAFVSSTGAIVATPVSYLQGSPDRDGAGVPYDSSSPYATWQTASYSMASLSAIFDADPSTNVGTLTSLVLSNRGVSGRLISVTLIGSAGTQTVSGTVFAAVFNANRPAGDPAMFSSLLDVAPIP
jgi:SpoIID/LytB domain protein